MSDDDWIFEYACVGGDDWEAHPNTDYLRTLYPSVYPMGMVTIMNGMNSTPFQFRRVPKDPLLRAIVLAQVEAG